MSTLVFLEHHGAGIQKASLGVLSKAASLDPDTSAVIIGSGVSGLAAEAARYGAARVFIADDPNLEAPLPQSRVDVLADLVASHGFSNVLFGASVLASDIAGALAARLDAGLNWDLTGIDLEGGALVGTRSALGDTVLVDVAWTAEPRLGLVRSGSFEPTERAAAGTVENIAVNLQDFSTKAKMVEQAHAEQTGPSIEEADILVAGGRGVGSPEAFKELEDLAGALGGAVASTRAVVDSGWYPYQTQVGQTGKTVAPKLYIACGISGAIQHKVGMQSSQVIVSINKDANAAIFDFSDVAVVGDLHDVVPKLTALVAERKG